MNTNKAAYWIALGVLAFGLNSEYQRGNFLALHRVAERADSMLWRISTRTQQSVSVAKMFTQRDEASSDSLSTLADITDLTRDQAELFREQAREQAEMVREQVRDEIQEKVSNAVWEQPKSSCPAKSAKTNRLQFRLRGIDVRMKQSPIILMDR